MIKKNYTNKDILGLTGEELNRAFTELKRQQDENRHNRGEITDREYLKREFERLERLQEEHIKDVKEFNENAEKVFKQIEDKEKLLNMKKQKQPEQVAPEFMKELIKDGSNFINSDDEEPDPIIQTITKYAKYVPLITQAIGGFMSRIPKGTNQQQSNKIQPPEGWLTMSELDKLKYKYERSGEISKWWRDGEAYDAAVSGGAIAKEQIYSPPAQEPQTLQSLATKYPPAPLVTSSAPPPAPAPPPIQPQQQQTVHLTEEDKQQNMEYVTLALTKLKAMTLEQFKNYIVEYEPQVSALIEKYKPYKILCPKSLRLMILNVPISDWINLFKAECPDKYAWLEENGKVETVIKIIEVIKQTI